MVDQKLWHMHSKVLDGFYQSDIIVIAADKEAAIEKTCEAFKEWVDYRLEEFGDVLGIWDEDDDFNEKLAKKLEDFRTEASSHISEKEKGHLLMHMS